MLQAGDRARPEVRAGVRRRGRCPRLPGPLRSHAHDTSGSEAPVRRQSGQSRWTGTSRRPCLAGAYQAVLRLGPLRQRARASAGRRVEPYTHLRAATWRSTWGRSAAARGAGRSRAGNGARAALTIVNAVAGIACYWAREFEVSLGVQPSRWRSTLSFPPDCTAWALRPRAWAGTTRLCARTSGRRQSCAVPGDHVSRRCLRRRGARRRCKAGARRAEEGGTEAYTTALSLAYVYTKLERWTWP